MENRPQQSQINEALMIIDRLIPLVNDAERNLSSARNWGFLDVLGGGFIVDLIKHSKLNNATNSMEQVNYLMQDLQRVLGSMNANDYSMNVGNFVTLADFLFDGAIADIYMTSKIMNSLDEVRKLKNRLMELRNRLSRYRQKWISLPSL